MKSLAKQEIFIAIGIIVLVVFWTWLTLSDDPFGMKEDNVVNSSTTTEVKCDAVTHHLLKNGKCALKKK